MTGFMEYLSIFTKLRLLSEKYRSKEWKYKSEILHAAKDMN